MKLKCKTNIFSSFSDYRGKADSECDDGSFTQRNKCVISVSNNQMENGANLARVQEATKSSKTNGGKQGGRRKNQNRSKAAGPSSQSIPQVVSDDDTDVENGVPGTDKSVKNNRRKRKEKEKVTMILLSFIS